ncbi:MAG TPA: hypothetical protein PLP42_06395 [Acidobacteriota bacterium]|nr:hypothetical protein [Acidobacteriota bacterium]
MKKRKQRYFVMHLPHDEPARQQGFVFEIQILDSRGRSEIEGYIGYEEATLEIAGHEVPGAVLAAARRQPEGKGDYVDEEGRTIVPF